MTVNLQELTQKYGDYYRQTPAQRSLGQLLMLANAIVTVCSYYPNAAAFDLSTSDQGRYGFVLSGVKLSDGTEVEYPYAAGFEDEMCEHLQDIDWDGVVGECSAGYATVEVSKAKLAELVERIDQAEKLI